MFRKLVLISSSGEQGTKEGYWFHKQRYTKTNNGIKLYTQFLKRKPNIGSEVLIAVFWDITP
jgi:hypothetical protein